MPIQKKSSILKHCYDIFLIQMKAQYLFLYIFASLTEFILNVYDQRNTKAH